MTSLETNSYQFSSDWFTHLIPVFTEYLSQFKNKKVKFLEVGSYEGRSAIWMLENILSIDSELICVEPGNPVRNQILRNNLDKFTNVCIINEKFSDAARKLMWEEPFDFVYIDGNHSKYFTYQDGIMALPMLKAGGLLAFDDYKWDQVHPDGTCPKEAIDKFIFDNPTVTLIHKGYQAWFMK